MLRDVILTIFCGLAALALYIHDYKLTLLLLLTGLLQYALYKQCGKWPLQRQQNYLAVQLIRGFVGGLAAVALIVAITAIGFSDAVIFAITVTIVCLPVSLWLNASPKKNRTKALLSEHNAIKVFRSSLATSASLLLLVLVMFAGLTWFHVAPAIQPIQVLLLGIAGLLPMQALRHDPAVHKLKALRPLDIDAAIYGRRALASYTLFGILTALAAYANYLFFFARHQLSPLYLDPTLPLYQQATTLTFTTLLLCSFIQILMERADKHDQFFTAHLHSNPRLVKAFGITLLAVAIIIYLPGLHSLFDFQALSLIDWLSAIFFASLYTLCRLLQRHTRKHTRHAVVRLHHETYSN
jgi:hypothetical protein